MNLKVIVFFAYVMFQHWMFWRWRCSWLCRIPCGMSTTRRSGDACRLDPLILPLQLPIPLVMESTQPQNQATTQMFQMVSMLYLLRPTKIYLQLG